MKSVLVAGGGIAGLAAASYLAGSGCRVLLVESSPKFGGRAYSLAHPEWAASLDNGQHLLMGCYKKTLAFLKLIGAEENVKMHRGVFVPFITADGTRHLLASGSIPYPLSLVAAVLGFSLLPLKSRIALLALMLRLPFINLRTLQGLSVAEWLQRQGQGHDTMKSFWEVLCVGTMNTGSESASAEVFTRVCKQLFLRGPAAAAFVVPSVPLSRMYVEPAVRFIEGRGGECRLSTPLQAIVAESGRVREVCLGSGERLQPDGVVIALPPYALSKVEGSKAIFPGGVPVFSYNPIVTLHVKLSSNPLRFPFYAGLDSPVQWIFNHGTYLTTVTSHAGTLINQEVGVLTRVLLAELSRLAGITPEMVESVKLIKEKRATFVPSPGLTGRPSVATPLKNVVLAGDYIDTGLPATLESAVISARLAAAQVLRQID